MAEQGHAMHKRGHNLAHFLHVVCARRYEMKPRHASAMCLDIYWGQTQNGAKVTIYECNKSNAQSFGLLNA